MTAKNMLIIKNKQGDVIGAQLESDSGTGAVSYILPAQAEHTIHRVFDVPAEIHGIAHPGEFHEAITAHVTSGNAKIAETSAEELQAAFTARS